MSRVIPGVCVLVAVIAAASLWAEVLRPDPTGATPEATTAAMLDAMQKSDWSRYAALLDPASLKTFRDTMAPVLRAAAEMPPEEKASLLSMFEGGRDIQTVLGWKPEEFFARYLKGIASQDPMKSALGGAETKVLGTVTEHSDVAHVVVRSSRKILSEKIERVEVYSTRKTDAGWRVELPSEYQVLAETVKLSFGNVQTETTTATDAAEPQKP